MKLLAYILFFTIILGFSYHTAAQTSMTNEERNLVKYWYYRNRLQYFMVQGNGIGESQVAGVRNLWNSGILNFGQQSAYLGDYIGVLATEYYLLNQNGQDVNQTLLELYYAMQTYIENMDKCESDYPWESLNMNDQYDGFFMRNNIPNNFVELHPELNKNVLPGTTHSGGDPGWVNSVSSNMCSNPYIEIMSQDEAIFLLRNLALVKQLVPNNLHFDNENGEPLSYNFNSKSIEIASKIISYIQFCPYGFLIGDNTIVNIEWIFNRPDYNSMVGNNSLFFQHGFRGADQFFLGYCFGQTPIEMLRFWSMIPYTSSLINTDHGHMASSLASVGNSWPIVIDLWVGYITVPATTLKIKNCTERHNWDTFYLLLWEVLQNETTSRLNMQKVSDQLNAAPCNGPYAKNESDYSGNGWASSAKFWHNIDKQTNGDNNFWGIYNGLDYMLLYNLYRIQNPGISPAYKNYHQPYLTGNVTAPENYIAMRSIQSEQLITTLALSVEYRAGESIELLPGFGTETGVHFTAYIEPVECDENVFGDEAGKQSTYARTITEDTLGYFTFECIPEIGDTLIFNGMDSDTANIFSYSWYFPSPAQILSGQSTRNPVVIFPVCNYNYELCSMAFTDSIGETNRVFFNIYKECCDSLELKNGTAPVNAYPNPNDGLFRLNSTETGVNYTLEVYNIFGELVYTGTSANGEAIINIKGTAPGLYMIKLFLDDGREQVLKILIK